MQSLDPLGDPLSCRWTIVHFLVKRIDVQEDALEVRIRAEGIASLIGELREQDDRKAA